MDAPDSVAVDVDGNRIPRDATHTNGWDYAAGTNSIQLYGSPCDTVMNTQTKKVDIIYGCRSKPIE